ncbi:molybdopterin synthase sulfur carrier subunit [Rothia kristinae]|uniref:Molybdopterin synthase sulfur carrier subunit n=1 Tax=Rothia kristinae TaxID=37923 RepID=A0A1S2MZH1_9MICC|nr:MoaD/ThiS family protein [Rothia kristinae]OIJ35400.1 molybdopterin synthase sulfur carrier subunit [Rothia kristinae]
MQIHWFAAAAAARGEQTEQLDTAPFPTLGDLLAHLGREHTEHDAGGRTLAEVLGRCTFLLDGRGADPEARLDGVARLDVLPPFAGG